MISCSEVSVILVVKNGEKYLAQALESVLNNDDLPKEILVIDGDSTDKTKEIATSFKLVKYRRQCSTGIANAYNEGVKQASGNYIAFLSHDDIWVKGKLRIQLVSFEKHPEILCAVSKFSYFLDDKAQVPASFRRELLEQTHTGFIMETLLAKKEVFDNVGLFNNEYTTGEDVDWFAKAKDKNIPIFVCPDNLLKKRVHNENSSLNDFQGTSNLIDILRKKIKRNRD